MADLKLDVRLERDGSKGRYRIGVRDPRTRTWFWRAMTSRNRKAAEIEATIAARAVIREIRDEAIGAAAVLYDLADELERAAGAYVWTS